MKPRKFPFMQQQSPLTPKASLKGFLLRSKVKFEFLEKMQTKHAQEAAQAAHLNLKEIAKTLVFVDENRQPFIAILGADREVNRHALQAIAGKRTVHLADERLAEHLTGYPTGGIPPIGHKHTLPVFIDRGILERDYVWCGGGARSKLVKLQVQDIIRLTNGKINDFSSQSKENQPGN